MRHRKAGRRLGRPSAHRQAMMTNMLISLVKHERITTTLGRAKELRIVADKVITLAKKNTTASLTALSRYIKSEREEVITKLVKELAPRYEKRNGGYTRVIKLGYRRGDSAPNAIVEYVDRVVETKPVEVAEVSEEETKTEE